MVTIMAVWGLNFVFAKVALVQLPPLLFSAFRFAIVAVVLVPFVKPPPRRLWAPIFGLSITMGALHFGMIFTGLSMIDPATTVILVNLQVPFAAGLAAIIFGDRLGWRRAAGMALAIAGLVVIAGEPRLAGSLTGVFLVVSAVFLWAVGNVQVKMMTPLNGFRLNAWLSLIAAPMLFAASWVLEDGQWAALQATDWRGQGAVLYNALIAFMLGYGLWYRQLRKYPVNMTMPITLLVPVFGVIFSVLLIDNPLTGPMIAGGLMTLAGVAVIIWRRPALAAPTDSGTESGDAAETPK